MRKSNPQLDIYGLAALRHFSIAQDFKRVRTVIVQPRINHVSERVQTVEEMEVFALEVLGAAAATTLENAPLVPSTKGCRWCKAKADCPALRAEVLDMFDNVAPAESEPDLLAVAMTKVDLIEGWCAAVREKVQQNLLSGVPVPGFKLVQGRRGPRAWRDKDQAEATLKAMRVPHDQMYDYAVVSPTTAEKLAKANVIGPRQWPRLMELITQADGKPSVAPESDKRPALVTSAVGDFDDVTTLS